MFDYAWHHYFVLPVSAYEQLQKWDQGHFILHHLSRNITLFRLAGYDNHYFFLPLIKKRHWAHCICRRYFWHFYVVLMLFRGPPQSGLPYTGERVCVSCSFTKLTELVLHNRRKTVQISLSFGWRQIKLFRTNTLPRKRAILNKTVFLFDGIHKIDFSKDALMFQLKSGIISPTCELLFFRKLERFLKQKLF